MDGPQPNSQQQITFPLDPASVQILAKALAAYGIASAVSQIIAGTGISVNPVGGTGNVTVTNTVAAPTDATLATSDITTNNVSTSKHGFAPKAPNDATKYLDGTGAYSTPSGTQGVWKALVTNYNLTTASGTQTIAHGLGKTPSYIRLQTDAPSINLSSPFNTAHSIGSYNGTTNVGQGWVDAQANPLYSTGAFIAFITDVAGHTQTAVATFDATNVYLAWTKSGTLPNATAVQFLEVFG